MIRQTERRRKQRGKRRNLWSDAILRGLKQEYGKQKKLLDDRQTSEVLVTVMELQKYSCAITGATIKLPTDEEIKTIGYTDWRRSLSDMDKLRLPRLVSVFPNELIKIGTMFFIIEGIYNLYKLLGIQGVAGVVLQTPIIYQYNTILERINNDTANTSIR